MGGSDQWGNIVTGIDLGRRMGVAHQLYALTCPLLTTASGAKMGKTASGAVWLNEAQLSAYDYWQYWRNTEDADVARFLKLFTTLPLAEIEKLAALGGAEINEAKKILATEATALIHGRDKATAAAETAKTTFEQGGLAAGLPTIEISQADLAASIGVLSAFVDAGLVASNSEARRQIKGGGLRVNDTAVDRRKRSFREGDLSGGWRDQAVARQEEACAPEAGLSERRLSATSSWSRRPALSRTTSHRPRIRGPGSCSMRARAARGQAFSAPVPEPADWGWSAP